MRCIKAKKGRETLPFSLQGAAYNFKNFNTCHALVSATLIR